MKESLSTDLESGYVEYNDGEKQNKSAMYFWNKPKLYVDEWRTYVVPIPLWRLIATIGLIYTFAYSCDWISTLCTEGSKAICVFTLLVSCAYFAWAIWWDEPYAVPVTWTFLKQQNFNACWAVTWIIYNTTLLGIAFFIVLCVFVLTYGDWEEIFKWECWP